MTQVNLITQAEYARSRKERGLPGGTPAAVLKAVASGRITLIDGKIDPTVADVQWGANTRPRADYHAPAEPPQEFIPASGGLPDRAELPPAPDQRGSEFWEAATREKIANAKLKEFEVEIQSQKLIDREGYERAAYTAGRRFRDSMVMTFPAKYAARLAPISDAWQLEQALRAFIRDELTALARDQAIKMPHETP